jgi:transcriptional regulator with XRE-family HTH domain
MSEPGLDKFGSFIHRQRRNQRWSQHQLGEKIGVRSSHITSLESGEVWPTDHVIDRIAELFGVPHKYLFAMLGPRSAQENQPHTII